MDFRRTSSADSNIQPSQPVFGRYSVTSEEGSTRSVVNESSSRTLGTFHDDDESVRTSRTSIDTFGTNPNLDKSTTPRKNNLTPAEGLGENGIELGKMGKKEASFTPLLMSQETFDNHNNMRTSKGVSLTRSSVRASLRTTNGGDDLEISAPTLLARASATGALHGANVNFVDDMDGGYKAEKRLTGMGNKNGKVGENMTSKDFLMATRSRILSINSRRYEGSKVATGITSVHEGVSLPDSLWWRYDAARTNAKTTTCIWSFRTSTAIQI